MDPPSNVIALGNPIRSFVFGVGRARSLKFETGLREVRDAIGWVLLGADARLRARSSQPVVAAEKLLVTILVIGAAAGLSELLDAESVGWSAALYFPALFFCTMFGGWPYGVIAWATSVAIVWLSVANAESGATDTDLIIFALAGGILTVLVALTRAAISEHERLLDRLLRLVDAADGFVVVMDGKGRPLGPNPRWTALTGMSWDESSGHGWLRAIHPMDRRQLPRRKAVGAGKSEQLELRVRHMQSDDWRWHRLRVVPVADSTGAVTEWIATLRDIHDRKLEAQRRELATSEVRHRLKNLMAIVEALAKYSAPRPGTEPSVDAFLKRYSGRLHALTAASDVFLAGNNAYIEASAVIRATLAPFMNDLAPRLRLAGPEIRLSEDFGGGLALAVHELATNAIKYGALSVPQGQVDFVWSSDAVPDGEKIVFDWKERRGPMPLPPSREGFGTRMIRAVTSRESTGAVKLDFEPDGLRCHISFTRRLPNAA